MSEYIKCCKFTKANAVIYYNDKLNSFWLGSMSTDFFEPIICCPWCGTDLDVKGKA